VRECGVCMVVQYTVRGELPEPRMAADESAARTRARSYKELEKKWQWWWLHGGDDVGDSSRS
jgi:hypothetical protein